MTALFLGRSDGPFAFHPVETNGGDFFALADVEFGQDGMSLPAQPREPMTPALKAALSSDLSSRS